MYPAYLYFFYYYYNYKNRVLACFQTRPNFFIFNKEKSIVEQEFITGGLHIMLSFLSNKLMAEHYIFCVNNLRHSTIYPPFYFVSTVELVPWDTSRERGDTFGPLSSLECLRENYHI